MKNANTKSRASSVSKLRARLLKSWAAVSVLAASLLFIGLLTGCPHNQPSAVDQPPVKPVDPAAILKTNGHGKITGYKCAKEALPAHLVIPAKIGDEEIKEIGEFAFYDCTGLTSVTLPANLTQIGRGAFYGCRGLTSVSLPANLTKIGGYAFSGCTGLTSITLPANLTQIGWEAFSGCTGLTSITLPANLTQIGDSAFEGCRGLTSLDLSACTSLTEIGSWTFKGCTGLTEVKLPVSLTKIGYEAFSGCRGLTSITLPVSLTKIDSYAFSDCTSLTSAVFADTTSWAVYDDYKYENKAADIQQSDLDNPATAATYLREKTDKGGYCDKYWKKR